MVVWLKMFDLNFKTSLQKLKSLKNFSYCFGPTSFYIVHQSSLLSFFYPTIIPLWPAGLPLLEPKV